MKTLAKFMTFATLLTLLFAAAIPVAFGQEEEEGPTTLDEVQRAAFLVGEWDITGQVTVDGAMQDISGVSTIDWDLEQHNLREDWTATVGGQVVEGISFYTYDAPNGRWQVVRTDTLVTPGILQMYGQLNGSDEFVAYTQGGDVTTRFLVTATDTDTLEVSLGTSGSLIDPFEPLWTMTYTRSSGAQTADDIRAAGEAVAAPAEAEQTAFLQGEWTVAAQAMNAETGEMEEGTGTSTFEQALGGFALVENAQAEFAEGPRMSWRLLKFNPESGMWEQASLDAVDTGFIVAADGQCDDTGCTLHGDSFSNITDSGFHFEQAGDEGPTTIRDYTRAGS